MHIQYVKSRLQKWFSFPQNKLYCQVSTTSHQGPHIRTMDLYDITEEGQLIFLTDTSTRKWMDLQEFPNMAVCLLNLDHVQIIVEGSAMLKTSMSDPHTVSIYWNNFLDQYWKDYYLSRPLNLKPNLNEIPSSFGLIVMTPNLWEILEINKEDFLKSSRKQFRLRDGVWVSHDLAPA